MEKDNDPERVRDQTISIFKLIPVEHIKLLWREIGAQFGGSIPIFQLLVDFQICALPSEQGLCKARINRFFFDPKVSVSHFSAQYTATLKSPYLSNFTITIILS